MYTNDNVSYLKCSKRTIMDTGLLKSGELAYTGTGDMIQPIQRMCC